MISRVTTQLLLLLAATALWWGSSQAATPDCTLPGGESCRMSAYPHAREDARFDAFFRQSFMSMLDYDAGGPNSFSGGPTLVYEMNANDDIWIKTGRDVPGALTLTLDNFDMTLVRAAAQSELLSNHEYWHRISQPASDLVSDDRSGEWITVLPKPSVAWLLVLCLVVVALRRLPPRFLSRER